MMRPTFFALPVGEGQDGAKTRNAVIEPAEMSYKRSIPAGFIAAAFHTLRRSRTGWFRLQTYKVFEDYRFMESQPSHQTLFSPFSSGKAAVHHSISIRSISFIKRAVSDKATIIF